MRHAVSFGKKCEQAQMFDMGIFVEQFTPMHIGIVYDKGEKRLKLWKDG